MATHTTLDADPLAAEATLEPELDWSALTPGRHFAEVSLVVSDAAVDAYLEATGEQHPAYARDGGGLVPPLWPSLVRLVKRSLGGRWPSGTIQLEHRAVSHRALRRGERLTLVTRIDRVETRNGRSYFDTVSTLRDVNGLLVNEQASASMWAGATSNESAAAPASGAPTPSAASAAEPPPRPVRHPALVPALVPDFGPLSASYPMDTLRAFGRVAGALDPIHVDEVYGRATRFGTNIAQGRLVMTLVSRLMLERFGPRWLEGGELSVRFVRPVLAGRRVSAWAAPDPETPDRWQVCCDDDAGQTVIVGWARPGPQTVTGVGGAA